VLCGLFVLVLRMPERKEEESVAESGDVANS
jgi:hypothetical protein